MIKLLAIAAHPDDEGAMLGTLAKHSLNHDRVKILWATKGENWLFPLTSYKAFLYWFIKARGDKKIKNHLTQIIGKIRSREAKKVLSLINAEGGFLGFHDGEIPSQNDFSAIHRIIKEIRTYKPTIVITHHFREPHPDHKNLSRLVYQAFFLS